MNIITDEAEFLREVIAEALAAPIGSVPITGVLGTVEVKGVVLHGFAVHLQIDAPADQEKWRVTHIKTGGCIEPDYDTMFDALVAVGIVLGSDMPWDEIDSHVAFLKKTTKAQRTAVRAKLDRIGGVAVDFVGEVAPASDGVVSAA